MKTGLLHQGQQAVAKNLEIERQVSVEGVVAGFQPLLKVPEPIARLLFGSGESIAMGAIHRSGVRGIQTGRVG